MRVHPQAELFRADGRTVRRTVMAKLIVALRSFGTRTQTQSVNAFRSEIHTEHINPFNAELRGWKVFEQP